MLTLPTFLILLLVGSLAVLIVGVARPRHTRLVALVALGVTALLWLLSPGQLPLSYSAPALVATTADSMWFWQVQRPLWLLSLALFLLQLGTLLHLPPAPTPGHGTVASRLVFLLGAAAHLALWAASLATLVISWSLLALLWALAIWESQRRRHSLRRALDRAAFSGVAIFLLWLAAAGLPGSNLALDVGRWPPLAATLLLLASVVHIALVPLTLWRSVPWNDESSLSALLVTVPGAAAGALLLRLQAASDIGLAFALPLTLAGLFGLLLAGYRAWSAAGPQRLAPVLVLAQTSLILLCGVWATPQAVAAETRVLLLGGGLLALAYPRLASRDAGHNLPAGAATALSIAALLGLPLTAGFQGRSALYGAWAAEGRWLLLLVTALLHLPLAAAGLLSVRQMLPASLATGPVDRGQLLRAAAWMLPGVGLLGLAALPEAGALAWLAILAPLALAWLLSRFLPDVPELERTLRQAFRLQLPSGAGATARRISGSAAQALRQAAHTLEGESGLLWLLLFLVILWLAR